MQIPGFKKIPESLSVSPAIKPLPALAVVSVMRSHNLIYFYCIFYSSFIACMLAALFPRLNEQPWWLVFIALFAVVAVILCHHQLTKIFVGKLWVEQGTWNLQGNRASGSYELVGDVYCWSLIILLPLRHQQTGKLIYLVLARDSVSPADNARVRTWLRVCLRPRT